MLASLRCAQGRLCPKPARRWRGIFPGIDDRSSISYDGRRVRCQDYDSSTQRLRVKDSAGKRPEGEALSKLADRLGRPKRQAHRIFEFVLGLCFLGLAGIGTEASMIEWRRYLSHPAAGLFWFYACAALTLILIFFSLYSFLKARSIR